MTKNEERNCRICKKGIKVFIEVKNNNKMAYANQKFKKYLDSDEGVNYNNVWFCNNCWSMIIQKKK